jgi:hypothetical protein
MSAIPIAEERRKGTAPRDGPLVELKPPASVPDRAAGHDSQAPARRDAPVYRPPAVCTRHRRLKHETSVQPRDAAEGLWVSSAATAR